MAQIRCAEVQMLRNTPYRCSGNIRTEQRGPADIFKIQRMVLLDAIVQLAYTKCAWNDVKFVLNTSNVRLPAHKVKGKVW